MVSESVETKSSRSQSSLNNSEERKSYNADSSINMPPSVSKSSNCNEIKCKTDGCHTTFATQKELKKHMNIHKLAAYNCPKCKKVYHSKSVHETHVRLCMPDCEDVMLIADEDIDSGPVECSVCSQLFENKKILKFHQRICVDGDNGNKGEGEINQEIEEIYLKTEIEDDSENFVPEY